MKAQKAQRKINLYRTIAVVIHRQKFTEEAAVEAVRYYEEVKDEVAISGITVDFLREAHEEYHDNNRNLETIEWLTEMAFQDLSRQMRWPEARKYFSKLMKMSGTSDDTDVFVHTVNERPLSDNPNGCAVVTLVVSHYDRFKNLLKQTGPVGYVHHSDETV